jgi:hypothetical protein
MAFQLNRVIPVINDLLGAKTWTRLPAELAEQLQLGYEVSDLIAEARSEVVSNSGNFSVVGVQTLAPIFPINQDEQGILLSFGAFTSASLAAGNTLRFRCGILAQLGGSSTIVDLGEPASAIVGERCAASWRGPIFANNQSAVLSPCFLVENFAGANIPFTVSCQFVRIRA